MTEIQIRNIQKFKGTAAFPIPYICDFEKRWYEVVGELKKSKVNLAKINLVEKLDRG